MLVYHGSDHIIEVVYNGSKRTNDYGYGFYTTESLELAREWACSDHKGSAFSHSDLFSKDIESEINHHRHKNPSKDRSPL